MTAPNTPAGLPFFVAMELDADGNAQFVGGTPVEGGVLMPYGYPAAVLFTQDSNGDFVPVSPSNPIGGGGGSTAAIAQISSGFFGNGGGVITLPGATAAGNWVLIVGAGYGLNTPVGFTPLMTTSNSGNQFINLYGKISTGGETSFAVYSTDHAQFVAYEIENFDGFLYGNYPNENVSPYEYFLPKPVITGAFSLLALTHDDSGAFAPDTIAGVTYDYINPGGLGNHAGAIGHTVDDWTGILTGTSDGSSSNYAYFTIYGGTS